MFILATGAEEIQIHMCASGVRLRQVCTGVQLDTNALFLQTHTPSASHRKTAEIKGTVSYSRTLNFNI